MEFNLRCGVSCHAMNRVYEQLREFTIEELERFKDQAEIMLGRDLGKGMPLGKAVAIHDLAIYQANETIRRKKEGIWE